MTQPNNDTADDWMNGQSPTVEVSYPHPTLCTLCPPSVILPVSGIET